MSHASQGCTWGMHWMCSKDSNEDSNQKNRLSLTERQAIFFD